MKNKLISFLVVVICHFNTTLAQISDSCGTTDMDSTTFMNQPWFGHNQFLNTFLDSLGYPPANAAARIVGQDKVWYHIPIKVWNIRRSDGTGGLSEQTIRNQIKHLNRVFNEINDTKIGFYTTCEITNLNSNNYYTIGGDGFGSFWVAASLTNNYYLPGVVNVYFTGTIGGGSNGVYFSGNVPLGPSKCIIVNSASANLLNGNTLAHEVGHYFGLEHTHRSANYPAWLPNINCYKECIDREREYTFFSLCIGNRLNSPKICESTGDALSDTPADPDLSNNRGIDCTNFNSNNKFTGWQDPWGDFYTEPRFPKPQVSNVMSYGNTVTTLCRTKFTRMQIGVMLYNCSRSWLGQEALKSKYIYDEYEPDNNWEMGMLNFIRVGEEQTRNFHQNLNAIGFGFKYITDCDVDWVLFRPTCSGNAVIKTYELLGKPKANTRLTLFAYDGTTQLAQNDDISSTNQFSSLNFNFIAGQTYAIKVDNMSPGSNTYYNLLIGDLAVNNANITCTSGNSICGTPTLGLDIGGSLPVGSSIEWEWNAPNGGMNFSCTNCLNPVVSYMGGYGLATITAKITVPCGLTDFPITKQFIYGVEPRTFNIVSYPLAQGQSEPTCFSLDGIYTFFAQNVYPNEVESGWEWGYRFGGVTYLSPFNNPYYTFFPTAMGTYEIFVRHKNDCGVSSQEAVRTIEVVGDCANGFRTASPSFSITASPNPAKNVIHLQANYGSVKASLPKNKVTIEIYKAPMNIKVKEFSFNTSATNYNLNVQSLEPGIYYVLYRDGTNGKTTKVVLQ